MKKTSQILFFLALFYSTSNLLNAQEEVLQWAEEMPLFAPDGCKPLLTKSERTKCSEIRWDNFVLTNLILPDTVLSETPNIHFYVNFQVDTSGNFSNLSIRENSFGKIGEEAIQRLFEKITEDNLTWTPALQNGKKVVVKTYEIIEVKKKIRIDVTTNDTIHLTPTKQPILIDNICEQENDAVFAQTCSFINLQNQILKERVYPQIALTNGVEGTVLLKFVIDKSGQVGNTEIARDIGAACGRYALAALNRLVENGMKWQPATVGGKPVNMEYTIDVPFRIEKVMKVKKSKGKRKKRKKQRK